MALFFFMLSEVTAMSCSAHVWNVSPAVGIEACEPSEVQYVQDGGASAVMFSFYPPTFT